MMLTEAQAREKWCPFARAIHVEKNSLPGEGTADTCASYNRDSERRHDVLTVLTPTASLCIASACMAWRWRDKSGAREGEANYYPGEWQGWCGLAGRATP